VFVLFCRIPFADHFEYVAKSEYVASKAQYTPELHKQLEEKDWTVCLLDDGSLYAFREEFKDQAIKKAIIEVGLRPKVTAQKLPEVITQLMTECWRGEANKRPTMIKVIEMLEIALGIAPPPGSS